MTCPNGLNRTMLVSFPRSGHHLLVRGLTEALDHRLVYSEFYSCVHNFETTPYVNLQKNHDFRLDLPFTDELHYIVLYRDFDPAVESWYKVSDARDTMTLEEFKAAKRPYYDGLIYKWVTQYRDRTEVVRYDDLVDDMFATVDRLCRHMGVNPNDAKLTEWSQKESRLR